MLVVVGLKSVCRTFFYSASEKTSVLSPSLLVEWFPESVDRLDSQIWQRQPEFRVQGKPIWEEGVLRESETFDFFYIRLTN